MLMIENAAALLVFGLWVVGFALGCAMRGYLDGARAEWLETLSYRQRQARKRAAYRRMSDGRR